MSLETDLNIPDELAIVADKERMAAIAAYRDFIFRRQKSIIIKCSDLDKVNFNEVEQDKNYVRKNNEQTRCIISWKQSLQPSFISQLSEYEGPFTIAELDHILENPEWNSNMDDDVDVNERVIVPPFHTDNQTSNT